jgi:hypothetical protein
MAARSFAIRRDAIGEPGFFSVYIAGLGIFVGSEFQPEMTLFHRTPISSEASGLANLKDQYLREFIAKVSRWNGAAMR